MKPLDALAIAGLVATTTLLQGCLDEIGGAGLKVQEPVLEPNAEWVVWDGEKLGQYHCYTGKIKLLNGQNLGLDSNTWYNQTQYGMALHASTREREGILGG